MSTDELTAAAERLHRLDNGESFEDVYPASPKGPSPRTDRRLLVDHILTSRPDDGESMQLRCAADLLQSVSDQDRIGESIDAVDSDVLDALNLLADWAMDRIR